MSAIVRARRAGKPAEIKNGDSLILIPSAFIYHVNSLSSTKFHEATLCKCSCTTLKGVNEMRRRVIDKPYGNFFKIIFGALKILALHLARLRIFAYQTQFLKSSIDVIDRCAWYLPDLGNASVGKLNQNNTHPL